MRLADGTLWPIPITLDVSEKFADGVAPGTRIALRDAEGVILAVMTVSDKWTPNKAHEAAKVFGADDLAHPAVNYLHNIAGPVYLGGPVQGLQAPVHYDFKARCAPISKSWAGKRSWPFKPATLCTAPTKN
jgi:sulfate adenylyltransferase